MKSVENKRADLLPSAKTMTGRLDLRGSIRRMKLPILFCLLSCLVSQAGPPISHPGFDSRVIEGWTVLVSEPLLKDEPAAVFKALDLLKGQLIGIKKTVPVPAVVHLQRVPLWFTPLPADIKHPRAEYHPGAEWLKDHGRDVAMAKGVQFTNISTFEQEQSRMPQFTLHELSHAFHDLVLGFDNADIIAAYEQAKAGGTYDHVQRRNGAGRPDTMDKAYAMTNAKEYFAECSEAYFAKNDFFPFTRAELKKHDPRMFAVLEKVWGVVPR